MTVRESALRNLRLAQQRGLVVDVEVEAGFATGTVGDLTDDTLRLDFNTGEPAMSILLADVLSVAVLGRQVSTEVAS